MRRIGCQPEKALPLAMQISDDPNLYLEGVFTHFPVSDTEEGRQFTENQMRVFQSSVDGIERARAANGLDPLCLIHAANSGAVLGHDLGELNMVRVGIAAYGYYPDVETPRSVELHPVMRLKSKVSFVKLVRAGETVSYGRTWAPSVDTYVATVPVGYADGFSRLNSNLGRMLIKGKSYPVAGRVCMDQTMLDLGPEVPEIAVGDEVIWLGKSGEEQITADELAANAQTISYEILTGIAPRVIREYIL
jgi:alanine racemase